MLPSNRLSGDPHKVPSLIVLLYLSFVEFGQLSVNVLCNSLFRMLLVLALALNSRCISDVVFPDVLSATLAFKFHFTDVRRHGS